MNEDGEERNNVVENDSISNETHKLSRLFSFTRFHSLREIIGGTTFLSYVAYSD